jgi:hypothetical protein
MSNEMEMGESAGEDRLRMGTGSEKAAGKSAVVTATAGSVGSLGGKQSKDGKEGKGKDGWEESEEGERGAWGERTGRKRQGLRRRVLFPSNLMLLSHLMKWWEGMMLGVLFLMNW